MCKCSRALVEIEAAMELGFNCNILLALALITLTGNADATNTTDDRNNKDVLWPLSTLDQVASDECPKRKGEEHPLDGAAAWPELATSSSSASSYPSSYPSSGSYTWPLAAIAGRCMGPLDSLLFDSTPTPLSSSSAMPSSSKEHPSVNLDLFCRQLDWSVNCTKNLVWNCVPFPYNLIYRSSLASLSEFVTSKCTELMAASDLPLGHDGPLAHVTMQATSMQQIGFSCLFNRVTYSKSNCLLSWRPFEPLVTVNTSCTIWTDYVACKLNEVRDECGCKMTQWLRDLFVALGGPIVRAYCGDYDDLLCQDNGHPYTSCSASCYVIMATVVLNVVARQLP